MPLPPTIIPSVLQSRFADSFTLCVTTSPHVKLVLTGSVESNEGVWMGASLGLGLESTDSVGWLTVSDNLVGGLVVSSDLTLPLFSGSFFTSFHSKDSLIVVWYSSHTARGGKAVK